MMIVSIMDVNEDNTTFALCGHITAIGRPELFV